MIDREFAIELVRVTERAAVAAAVLSGRGDEHAADQAAVDAMRRELNALKIDGTVVIGEGERDKAPMLFIGERVGRGGGPVVDIALDPLEGTTLTAKGMPGALAVIAMADGGCLLNAPDVYMNKIAVGGGYREDVVDLDKPVAENIRSLAAAKGVPAEEIGVCILDRPRHEALIREVRESGARTKLITDGDVAGVVHVTEPSVTGIDLYMGIGGAPEGVLAAAALHCIGGWMQGRLEIANEDQHKRAVEMGGGDPLRKLSLSDMARGDVLFAATGVTGGVLLDGVRRERGGVRTHSLIMRSSTGTTRWIRAHHKSAEKFDG